MKNLQTAMAAVSVSSSSSCHLLHHLLRQPRPTSAPVVSCLLLRPLCISSTNNNTTLPNHKRPTHKTPFHRIHLSISQYSPSHTLSSFPLSSVPTKSSLHSLSSLQEPEEDPEQEQEEEEGIEREQEEERDHPLYSLKGQEQEEGIEEFEGGDGEIEDSEVGEDNVVKKIVQMGVDDKKDGEKARSLLSLTVKEKKELASYAHSLGDKLKCQLVGKSGVTDTVVSSFIETLEKNELLKIKIHRTCPGDLADVVKHLEEATGSLVVGQIGQTVIVYRPSLTKMKAEEKKRQARRVYVRKEREWKPTLMKKVQAFRGSGCGRRGSSKV